MSPNRPRDELIERYQQAKAAMPDGLPDQPSAALHERIMRAAREQAYTINSVAHHPVSKPAIDLKGLENGRNISIPSAEATNDSFWTIKFVASLAVMGLSGLLWYQFEHGTPQEQEAAKSATPSATVVTPASAPSPAPAAAPAAAPATPPTPVPESTTPSAPGAAKKVAPAVPVIAQAPTIAPAKQAPIASAEMASRSAAAVPAGAAAPDAAPTIAVAPAPTVAVPQLSQADKALANVPSRKEPPVQPPQRSTDLALAANESAVPPPARAAVARAAPMPAPAAPRPAPAPAPLAVTAKTDPLFAAIDAKDATALRQALHQGISPHARTPDDHPALTRAVIQRWPEGVRILLAAGADRSAKNNKGHTAADVALGLGYSDMAELLATSR